VVHVDDADMRAPLIQDRLGFGQVTGSPDDEQSVIQCQLDQIDEQRSIMKHESPTRTPTRCFHVNP